MTKEQTNSWESEFEDYYKGAMVAYPISEHQKWMKIFIERAISQEREKWIEEKVKELQDLVPDWLNKQDIINLLQNK